MTGSVRRAAGWTGLVLLALLVVLILVLVLFPLNWLKGPIADLVAARTGRTLNIQGDLDIDWGLRPKLQVGALQFGNADWSDRPNMAELEAAAASVDLRALFAGRLSIPEVHLVRPRLLLERGPDGRPNWVLREEEPEEPFRPPDIGRLRIEQGEVRYREQDGGTDLQVRVESGAPGTEDAPLRIEGEGRLHGETFRLDARGDSLLALYDARRPYGLRVELEAEQTQLHAEGKLEDPLQLAGLDLRVRIAGPDPARLNRLLAIPLPNLPPYDLSARLQRRGDEWRLRNIDAKVGDSDLRGEASVRTGGEVPRVNADLNSEQLDFDDLGGLVGAEPGAEPGETASPEQREAQARREADPRALPDTPLDVAKLQTFDAEVRYSANRVETGKLPIDALLVDLRLQAGQLQLAPVRFHIGDGRIDTRIDMNTRKQPMAGQLTAEVRNVDLRRVLAAFELADESAGTLAGRAKLWMEGDSVRELLASADGGLYLLMTGGQLDKLLVELAGLDAAESLVAVLGDRDRVPIECAYADLQSRDGVVEMPTFVIDSTDTLFLADGTIDLNDESLDIELRPEPKDWSPAALRGPLHIEGTLKDVQLRPGGTVIARGAATLLAAAAAPFTALLPLLDPGPAEDEGSPLCGGLVESMREQTKEEPQE